MDEVIIITISHRKKEIDGKYVSPQEFFRQEIPMQWLNDNNPKVVQKIIAVVNNLTTKEI